ncbi:MAG: hypothetical protein HQL57_07475 [Magnetococcales bacterium]|nr:hypothetical protein [Magnetococcales bacterium]MBF0157006.1 hypothetical protein [Magnetococcales bacterium]
MGAESCRLPPFPGRDRSPRLALGVNLVAALFLSLPFLLLGSHSPIRLLDGADGYLPLISVAGEELRQYGLQLWQPLHGGGIDRMASMYGYYSLVELLHLLLPATVAYRLGVALFFAGAIFLTFLLLRRLGCRRPYALFGAFFYAILNSGQMQDPSFGIHMGLLPGFILALSHLFARFTAIPPASARLPLLGLAFLLGVGFSLANSIFALWPYSLVFVTLYFLLFERRLRISTLLPFALFGLGSLLAASPLVIALVTNHTASYRDTLGTLPATRPPHFFALLLQGEMATLAQESLFALKRFYWSLLASSPDVPYLLWRRLWPGVTHAELVIHPLYWATPLFWGLALWRSRRLAEIPTSSLIFDALFFVSLPVIAFSLPFLEFFLNYDAWALGGFKLYRFLLLFPLVQVVILTKYADLVTRPDPLFSPFFPRLVGGVCLLGALLTAAGYVHFSLDHYWRRTLTWGNQEETLENPALEELAHRIRQQESEPFRVASVARFLNPNTVNRHGLESFDTYSGIMPKRYAAYFRTLIRPLGRGAFPAGRHKFFIQPDPATVPEPTATAMCGHGHPDLFLDTQVSYFRNVAGSTSWNPERPPYRLADFADPDLLALANVRYLFSRTPITGDGLTHLHTLPFLLPEKADGPERWLRDRLLPADCDRFPMIHLYRLETTLPRFFPVYAHRLFDDDASLLKALAETPVGRLAQTALLTSADAQGIPLPTTTGDTTPEEGSAPAATSTGIEKIAGTIRSDRDKMRVDRVRVARYTPDHIRLEVTLPVAAIVVATNSFNRNWQARIDGVASRSFPVYHTFTGVSAPAGAHTLELEYQPPMAPLRDWLAGPLQGPAVGNNG